MNSKRMHEISVGLCMYLTLNDQFQWMAVWFDLGPVVHHAADVFSVVCRCRNHAVLADNCVSVVCTCLRHCCCVAIGCGHPRDLGTGPAILRLTSRHNDRLSACVHCYDGGRVLRLSWWLDGLVQEWTVERKRHRVAERRLKDIEIKWK